MMDASNASPLKLLPLLVMLLTGCGNPDELKLKAWLPGYMQNDAGQSRMWLACSPDGIIWHRVQRMYGPGTVRGAFEDPTCRVLRWEIEP